MSFLITLAIFTYLDYKAFCVARGYGIIPKWHHIWILGGGIVLLMEAKANHDNQ